MVYVFTHKEHGTKIILANDLIGISSEQKKRLTDLGWTCNAHDYEYAHSPKDMREMVDKIDSRVKA